MSPPLVLDGGDDGNNTVVVVVHPPAAAETGHQPTTGHRFFGGADHQGPCELFLRPGPGGSAHLLRYSHLQK